MSPETFARILLRHRLWFAGAVLVLLIGAGLGASQLRFDFTPQNLFVSGDSDYAYLSELHRIFGRDDNVLLIHLRGEELFTAESVAYLGDLHRNLAAIDGVIEVEDLTTAVLMRPGSPMPSPLIAPGETAWEEVRARALGQPLLAGRLVSADGEAALLWVRVKDDELDYDSLQPVVEAVVEVVERTGRPPGIEVAVVGIPLVRVLIVNGLVQDQLTFFPLCALLFAVVLGVIFRDLRAVLVPFLAVVVSLVYTAGLLGVTGEEINIINNVLPTLLFVIGVSDAIHLMSRYRGELSRGTAPSDALGTSVRHLTVACLLTSVTTAVGFLSLTVGRLHILRQFGLYSAAGVLLAYVVTVVLVPIVLSFLSPTLKPGSMAADRLAQRWSAWTADFTLVRRRWVVGGGLLLVAAALYFSSHVKVQNFLFESLPPDHPAAEANRHLERDFNGIVPLTIAVEWQRGVDVMTVEVMRYLEELGAFLDSEAEIGGVVSVVDLLKELNLILNRGDPASRRLPETDAEMVRLFSQLEGALASSGHSELLARVYSAEERKLRIASHLDDVGSIRLGQHAEAVEARLRSDRERHARLGIRCRLSGDGPVATAAVDRLIRDMLKSLLAAFVLILVTMCLLLRSIRAALISMIPNLFPLIMTLGFMGLIGLDLQVPTIIVFTVALGLAVDDTIHFMARFREEWKELDPATGLEERYDVAIRRSVRGTGQAIFTTSVVLAVGYSVLLLSRFPITHRFGLGMLVTVIAALVGDVFLLPACLAWFRPFRR